MDTLTKHQRQLIKDYVRPIVHMRHQLQLKRFGLVFGAGLSKSFDLPNWPELVGKIAADREVRGNSILDRFTARDSLPFRTELLFQHFRKLQGKKYVGKNVHSLEFENRTFSKWLKICAKHLYRDSPDNCEDALSRHPYLARLIPIIQDTQLTVTYNFDDYLERTLGDHKRADDPSRGFETVTNPRMQFRRPSSVVYHPNGVIPSELMELPTDRFVFSESSFAKQMVGALTSDTSFLVNHFCKNTCLIIGSSLEDETLRNVLVQSAEANPGNCHYHVHFLPDGKKLPPEDADAIRRANFNVFNLITLFLDQSGIAALAEVINPMHVSDDVLSDLAKQAKTELTYRFYITGPLGVGKSTTANQLRNLVVLDEWLEPRPSILAKPWETLKKHEKKQADDWIIRQFRLKNDSLRYQRSGIFMVDRPPLDPLVFTPPKERHAKAKLLLDTICPNSSWPVANGTIILLKGQPDELSVRLLATGRDGYTPARLEKMQEDLAELYKGNGIVHLDTCGMSIREVTKQVAEIIHFRQYKSFDLDAVLRRHLRKSSP